MRYLPVLLLVLGLIICPQGSLLAITIHVPDDQPTIQAGIDAAVNGDTVLVADGTYRSDGNRDIDFTGKNIVLTSENGPDYTIIDCEGSPTEYHRAVHFHSGEGPTAELIGFKLTNGYSNAGGAIRSISASPTIKNCIFVNNMATNGGAIYYNGDGYPGGISQPLLTDCVLEENTASDNGGAIYIQNNNIKLFSKKCIYYNNDASVGGAIAEGGSAYLDIQECTFYSNYALGTASITTGTIGGLNIDKTIIAFSNDGASVYCVEGSSISRSNFYGNPDGDWVGNISGKLGIDGNISLDPEFCDMMSADLTIDAKSPCAPYNNGCGVLIGACGVGCGQIIRSWYVSTTGNDEYGDGSSENPYRTVQFAANQAINGDTISVGPGTYEEHILINSKSLYLISEDGRNNTLIYSDSSRCMTIQNSEYLKIEGFSFTGQSLVDGGAIHIDSSTVEIYSSLISNSLCSNLEYSDSHRGGGIYSANSRLSLFYTEIAGNAISSWSASFNAGGGIYSTGILLVDSMCVIDGNEVEFVYPMGEYSGYTKGGGIYYEGDSCIIKNSRIFNNECFGLSFGGLGSGICIIGNNVMIENCQIEDNTININRTIFYESSGGGGIYIQGNDGLIMNNQIINNSVNLNTKYNMLYKHGGGGISVNGDNYLITNNIIVGNKVLYHCTNDYAIVYGAGCYLNGNNELQYNIIAKNKAISCLEPDNDNLIFDTTSSMSQGGGCYIIGASVVSNNTIVGNLDSVYIKNQYHEKYFIAKGNGAGCYIESTGEFTNNITAFNRIVTIFDNSIEQSTCTHYREGAGVYLESGSNGCNDYFGNVGDSEWYGNNSTTNINFNPLLCDTEDDDYHIYDISPCAAVNNDCGELIGAFDVGCYNIIPEITSNEAVSVYEDSLLTYKTLYTDDDGPDTTITFENIPSWITAEYDSLYGFPTEGIDDTSILIIVSDSYKADSLNLLIDVIPVNDPPVLSPIGPRDIYEDNTLEIHITSSDVDSESLSLLVYQEPDNSLLQDSGNGNGLFTFTPSLDQGGIYNVLFVSSDGELADSEWVEITIHESDPVIHQIIIDGQGQPDHVLDHNPLIEWIYSDPLDSKAQSQFEIAVGNDDDWTYAEMWNPAPIESLDTFIVYNGSPLVDGETYYLRLRLHNGEVWSYWYETLFHMNSIPTIPVALSPINYVIVTDNQPIPWIQNSTDAEPDDTLTYEFVVANDTTFGEPDPIWEDGVAEDTDSTGWQVTEPLDENWQYYWNCRAFDQYEYSDWGDPQYFWVNAVEEAPGDFGAFFPPDTDNAIITDMLTVFWWGEADEPDPLDSVYYTLYISIDSNFNFVNTIDSIWTNIYTLTMDDSLEFGTRYWWKVQATDNTGLSTYSANTPDFRTWMLGDANQDWQVNILDAVFLINFLYKGGPAPIPIVMGDVNGSCSINLLDITHIINYLYKGGPTPVVGCE